MSNNTQQDKDTVMKSLAIAGFVGLIIVIAWLGMKVVQTIPGAFSSLASIADSVYNHPVKATVTAVADTDTVTTGKQLTISWDEQARAGSYAFSYACAEGLAVDLMDTNGSVRPLSCATNYALGAVQSATLTVYAERERYTDLRYTIDFIPAGSADPLASDSGVVNVVNTAILVGGTPVVPDTPVATSTPTTTPVTPVTPTTPKPPVKPTTPTYVQTPVYGLPASNPNGTTDLAATFVGVGTLTNGVFQSTSIMDNDTTGAIRFAVKNLGTKTSNAWIYTATLPTGETYTSSAQLPLKPNEQAVITVGFTLGDTIGVKNYTIKVSITPDTNSTNNGFSSVVAITD